MSVGIREQHCASLVDLARPQQTVGHVGIDLHDLLGHQAVRLPMYGSGCLGVWRIE